MITPWKFRGLFLLCAGMICLGVGEAAMAKPPSILSVRAESGQVGLYEKFELRIDLDATFTNPFDPEQIDLMAEFTAPSGKKYEIWGFYNPSDWAALWMVRFSPNEIGDWRYVVTVKDSEGSASSRVGNFAAADAAHHGFVTIAANGRYLKHDDGTSFYGVGLWYNDSYALLNQGRITEAGLDDLAKRGAANGLARRRRTTGSLRTGCCATQPGPDGLFISKGTGEPPFTTGEWSSLPRVLSCRASCCSLAGTHPPSRGIFPSWSDAPNSSKPGVIRRTTFFWPVRRETCSRRVTRDGKHPMEHTEERISRVCR